LPDERRGSDGLRQNIQTDGVIVRVIRRNVFVRPHTEAGASGFQIGAKDGVNEIDRQRA
jgi:hypothetical protein